MMSVFKLEIATDNDAFNERAADTVAEILRTVAGKLERDGFSRGQATIRDINGNGVGFYHITAKRR